MIVEVQKMICTFKYMYVNLSENNTTYYMVLEEQEGSILADLCRVELPCG